MSVGLLALLDDVGAIAKVAATSIDDVAGQAARAGAKAAGAVIDDAAVTPRYVQGFSADRELPIVRQIALGSIRNKLLILLPVALLLSAFLPGLITPLLMIGGAYLCYEGAEKAFAGLFPHRAHAHEKKVEPNAADAKAMEKERVAGAIKTDFILSAEIMAIALSTLPASGIWTQALILVIVSVGITAAVYGGVALIVKADDVGVYLAKNARTGLGRGLGRGLVRAMPVFMKGLSVVGTAAMLWVGGQILVHGLAGFGWTGPEHWIEAWAHAAGAVLAPSRAIAEWLVIAALSGVVGLAVGLVLIPVAEYFIAPLAGLFRRKRG